MKITDPKIIYDYLVDKYDTWFVTRDKKTKDFIEECVIRYIQNIDDSYYLEANDGCASGLCSFPNFEQDLKKLINILFKKIN